MAKYKPNDITDTDLAEFIANESDFGFEITVLKSLRDLGFECIHSGTYEDPVTQKPRQFDIRASHHDRRVMIRMMVECKNLKANFPLLVSCLPRAPSEAYHEVIASFGFERNPQIASIRDRAVSLNSRDAEGSALYEVGQPVGKSCDQVGRANQTNELVCGDSEVYDKWSQALSSADDVIRKCAFDAASVGIDIVGTIVLPVVVVPNDRLWIVQYDLNGALISAPEKVDRCPVFVERHYQAPDTGPRSGFKISHFDFLTLNGLAHFVNDVLRQSDLSRRVFMTNLLLQELQKRVK